MTTTKPISNLETIELSPNYIIPSAIVLGAIPLGLANIWLSVIIACFGLFLTIQTALIRLRFTPAALDVYRSGKKIRSFPYAEWSNWRIFWSPIPILFYFREVNSIHFLPIIFDAATLRACLEKFCPQQG
jgi:Protein of unknown function (DUF3119)